jgi:Fe2+ or Zn2+ uptake regulation protein
MKKTTYQIRKISKEHDTSIILDNSLGKVLELSFDDASRLCQLMNKGSSSDIRYEMIVVYGEIKTEGNE